MLLLTPLPSIKNFEHRFYKLPCPSPHFEDKGKVHKRIALFIVCYNVFQSSCIVILTNNGSNCALFIYDSLLFVIIVLYIFTTNVILVFTFVMVFSKYSLFKVTPLLLFRVLTDQPLKFLSIYLILQRIICRIDSLFWDINKSLNILFSGFPRFFIEF